MIRLILLIGIFWNVGFDNGELEFMRINRIDEVDGRPGEDLAPGADPVDPFTLTTTQDQDQKQSDPYRDPQRPQHETSNPQPLYYMYPIPNVGMRCQTPTVNQYVPHVIPQHATMRYPTGKPVYICIA